MSKGIKTLMNATHNASYQCPFKPFSESIRRLHKRDMTSEYQKSKLSAQDTSAVLSKTPHNSKSEGVYPARSILKKCSSLKLSLKHRRPSVTIVEAQDPISTPVPSSSVNLEPILGSQQKTRNIQEIASKEELMTGKLQELAVYSNLFDDIIKQDNLYGVILANVKSKYDEYIRAMSEELQYLKTTSSQKEASDSAEIKQLKGELHSFKSSFADKQRKIQELETENGYLNKNLHSVKIKHTEVATAILQEVRESKLRENKLREELENFKGKEASHLHIPRLQMSQVSSVLSTDSSSPSLLSTTAKRAILLLTIPESQQEQLQDNSFRITRTSPNPEDRRSSSNH